jgi:hypothetical protein
MPWILIIKVFMFVNRVMLVTLQVKKVERAGLKNPVKV